ncbi:adenylyl-sulfate kinase [Halococcus hamelinensis]|uniref:Adenylyl-sulfate kinase n=1 Tax=Halococcus hamelinensis 100A6 TaxID=1132509 RepID=M0M5Y3_9EURY|nr:adenylyl-sulfate kinase [Halococcus hamelinensis]EMA41227.1 sulfate adenylyltransferase subunit 1/adenylylsulfate kinase [Halococcus hamelinensis 100A6]
MGDTLWLFGLPCSGKTTLAEGLVGPSTVHLDGDYLRNTLSSDLGFSKADRTENLRRAAGVAQALNEQGFDVVASFITPYRSQRELVAEVVENVSFVFVDTPLEVCEERDVKGMYERARRGEIEGFTGIDAPFEGLASDEAGLEVRTATNSKERIIAEINETLDRKLDPSHVFIGRWQPLHDGHRTIIDSAADNGKDVVIAIRDTELSEKNPLTAQERRDLIETVYEDHPNVETMIVPDIDTVAIGRDVGYSVVAVPEDISGISGTETREKYGKSELLEGRHFRERSVDTRLPDHE